MQYDREAAAKATYEAVWGEEYKDHPWEQRNDAFKRFYYDMADAVIATLPQSPDTTLLEQKIQRLEWAFTEHLLMIRTSVLAQARADELAIRHAERADRAEMDLKRQIEATRQQIQARMEAAEEAQMHYQRVEELEAQNKALVRFVISLICYFFKWSAMDMYSRRFFTTGWVQKLADITGLPVEQLEAMITEGKE